MPKTYVVTAEKMEADSDNKVHVIRDRHETTSAKVRDSIKEYLEGKGYDVSVDTQEGFDGGSSSTDVESLTPHEGEHADAEVELAEASAEVAEEAAEEAIEMATATEEAIGEAEAAIPDDSPPEVREGILEVLETTREEVEAAASEAVEVAEVAEVAGEVAESAADAGDVETAEVAAEVAVEAANIAEAAAEDSSPEPSHWYYRTLNRR